MIEVILRHSPLSLPRLTTPKDDPVGLARPSEVVMEIFHRGSYPDTACTGYVPNQHEKTKTPLNEFFSLHSCGRRRGLE
jgi:hypothetical protein